MSISLYKKNLVVVSQLAMISEMHGDRFTWIELTSGSQLAFYISEMKRSALGGMQSGVVLYSITCLLLLLLLASTCGVKAQTATYTFTQFPYKETVNNVSLWGSLCVLLFFLIVVLETMYASCFFIVVVVSLNNLVA